MRREAAAAPQEPSYPPARDNPVYPAVIFSAIFWLLLARALLLLSRRWVGVAGGTDRDLVLPQIRFHHGPP